VRKKFFILCLLLVFVPNSVFAINQWYLNAIHVSEAWKNTKGSPEVVVAILDTGLDINHPDIMQNLWVNTDELAGDGIDNDGNGYIDDINGWDFINSTPDPRPKLDYGYDIEAVNHGTFVAGVVAALSNNQYVDGVAPKVKIMPLLVLNSYGYGDPYPVAEAINYAIDNGADIINLSFGGVFHSQALKSAILRAYEAGVVVVAAAGNASEGSDGIDFAETPVYPICYDQEWEKNAIIGVAALDENDKKADFSNYGKGCIDISAPGVNFSGLLYQDNKKADFLNYTADEWQGTSFAAALVSGAAALIKSAQPIWQADKIREILLNSAQDIDKKNPEYKDKLGQGKLDLNAAFSAIQTNETSESNIFVAAQNQGTGTVFRYNASWKKIDMLSVFSSQYIHGLNLNAFQFAEQTYIITGAVAGDKPWVRVIDLSGKILSSFFAYNNSLKAGLRVAGGDLDNDGKIELITVPASIAVPEIKIFNIKGQLQQHWLVASQKTDLNIDIGDVDKDGYQEIVVALGVGTKPEIKVFDFQGKLKKTFSAFVPQFKGSINLRVKDLDGDGQDEILVGAGAGQNLKLPSSKIPPSTLPNGRVFLLIFFYS